MESTLHDTDSVAGATQGIFVGTSAHDTTDTARQHRQAYELGMSI